MKAIFLTRRWIALTLFLIVFVTGCIYAALWQWGRYDERKASNALQVAHLSLAPAPIETVLSPGARVTDQLVYRRVTITGTFDVAHEIVFASRSFEGISGNEMLTPLVDARGNSVIVDRGWVPLRDDTPGVAEALPPSGRVTIEGVLLRSQKRGLWGPKLPPTGVLSEVLRIDVPRLAKQIPHPVYPMYVLERAQDPAQPNGVPRLLDVPPPDAGPFLSYTIQWFCFAVIACITYSVLARNAVRAHRRRAVAAPAQEEVRA